MKEIGQSTHGESSLPDHSEIRRIGELVVVLAARDLRVRYKQSVLGVLWAVIQPVCLMAVFVLVLGPSVQTSLPAGEPYALFVLAGLVPWGFFSNSLTQSANCLVANRNLVTKVYFPRESFPIACVATALVDFSIGLMVFGGLMTYYLVSGKWSASPSLAPLCLPVIVLLQAVLTAGLGMILAMANLFHRDVRSMVPVALNLGMFVSAVVLPVSSGVGWVDAVISFNPLVHIITAYRDCLLHGRLPGWLEFNYIVVTSIGTFTFGWLCFRRSSHRFAECI